MTGKRDKVDCELPEIPDCPGPQALRADEILERPKPTKYFKKNFPKLTRTYNRVVSKGVPNYRGAMVKLESKLKIKEWEKNKEKFKDKTLISMLTYGFPIGYATNVIPATGMTNHSSARQHPVSVGNYIAKELKHEALIGPMEEAPFEPWTRTSPLMTRPKADPALRRVILDLSFPEDESVNDGIPCGWMDGANFKMRLPSPHDLA